MVMQRIGIVGLFMMVVVALAGCSAASRVPGATVVYTRVMTDQDGKLTPFRALRVADRVAFVTKGIDESTNYAAAKLDFELPTFVIVFNALPGPTITHTKDLSKAIPLLARELCGDNPINNIQRELDWETGERNVYVECKAPSGRSDDLDEEAAAAEKEEENAEDAAALRWSKVDPDYRLRFRVIYDRNGDPSDSYVTISPDGTREVNKPY